MAFFGRRKPGFAKEANITEQELTNVINDSNNNTFRPNDESPKTEKRDWKAIANAVLGLKTEEIPSSVPAPTESAAEEAPLTAKEVAEAAAAEGTRTDLFDYLDTLPDVADPFPKMEEEPAEPEQEEELSEAQLLADFIRERAKAALLTSLTYLKQEVATIDELLTAMEADEACQSIHHITGKKDIYYYDSDVMTDNYAMIAALIEDKDTTRTIAEMVRWNGKTYPSPTPVAYFMRHPYNLTMPQMQVALHNLERDPDYADIKTFTSEKGNTFLYSEPIMSMRYAKSLADRAEDDEG